MLMKKILLITKKANYFFEENMSQASSVTSNSGNSFWNLNKANLKDDQNNFTSKSFLNLQILLSGLLIIILTMIIISIFSLKILQSTFSDYFQNYFILHRFVRTFQQFSYSFMALLCVVKPDGTCEEHISSLDTKEFNQSLFLLEQNEYMAEFCSESITKLIQNSETIKDDDLIGIFKENISYHLMNIKKINNYYDIIKSELNISFSDALLLLSNNMRIIVSKESKLKNREKEPIYLIYGLDKPFENIKNKSDDFSDYQISVYTYLINYKLFVQKFTSLSERLNELINQKNNKIIKMAVLFHFIILVIMMFELLTIFFYLLTFNKILAQIINSIIIKFDIIYDDENDFRKLFSTKICQLEAFIVLYPTNPINSMREINKNYLKYKNLVSLKKKNEQRFNLNKKSIGDEDEKLIFKNNKKYINWTDIYKKGYNRFYIIIIWNLARLST